MFFANGEPNLADKVAAKASEAIDKPLSVVERLSNEMIDFAGKKGPAIIGALVIFIIAWMISKWVRRLLINALTRAHVDSLLAKFFANIARWGVVAFAVVTCMGTLGIETTSLAALIGATGLAVGLALQGNLGNLASGVLLLIFRPFKIGDSVVVAGQAGVVDGIDLFTTNLDTADNRRIIVPNNAIFSGIIENQTYHPRRAVTITMTVAPHHNLDRTRELLLTIPQAAAAAGMKGLIADPAPTVVLQEITPATVWQLITMIETAEHASARPALLRAAKALMEREQLAPALPVTLVRNVP